MIPATSNSVFPDWLSTAASRNGLYLHIPFCKQACHYCNFHFSTSARYQDEMVDALIREMELRLDYLPSRELHTVYLGGGTPSVLSASQLQRLFQAVFDLFSVKEKAEITLEANPDDLKPEVLAQLRDSPVNRLSVGIQSFSEADLQYMNRAHNAQEAYTCIEQLLGAGFDNLTLDLIYGTPTLSDEQWAANLEQIRQWGIPHLSCYSLTVEPRTALDHLVRKGKHRRPDEEQAAAQFEYLMDWARANDFLHYEISNFACPGRFARHNTHYWLGAPYLGIGPSAHSFDGTSRQWNVANNAQYMKSIEAGKVPSEREELAPTDQYNEYLMTGLRTMWGVSVSHLQEHFPQFVDSFFTGIQPLLYQRLLIKQEDRYALSDEGKLLADRIASDLFQ
jgi:oxygen-independent coproporphyrinogen-3 oxidase